MAELQFYDAHNHLQVDSLASVWDPVITSAAEVGVRRMVVNGSTEEDWEVVEQLARKYPLVYPSFGLHPWYIQERSKHWRERLIEFLDRTPSAIGEIGLDRWIEGYDLPAQEEVFLWQLDLAAERNLPASIHCLRAWGRLYDLLREHRRPERGFLLHAYGGSAEMVPVLAKLGAYFSISGQYAHDWKKRQRETFRSIPRDRILIESDAPFMFPPDHLREFELDGADGGKPWNHPANLRAIYRFVAELLEIPIEELSAQVEENFFRLFGRTA